MQGTCKLCKAEADLKESHFIPKFVGKWVKKTGITGYLREKNEINKRQQDIAKEHWLCGDCEGLFSDWESEFANKVFYPFVDEGKSVASYKEWMPNFGTSLSWRTLTFIRSKNTNEENPQEYYDALDAAQEHWARFLLGQEENLNQFEQHVFPLDKIESTNNSNLPNNINRYFLRTMAMDIVGNSTDIYVYTKLPSFIFLGIVRAKNSKIMRSSRIALRSGKLSPRKYHMPGGFGDYIEESANTINETYNQISEKDKDRFEEFIKNNPEKTANSKLFEAFQHDYKQFGDDVFR